MNIAFQDFLDRVNQQYIAKKAPEEGQGLPPDKEITASKIAVITQQLLQMSYDFYNVSGFYPLIEEKNIHYGHPVKYYIEAVTILNPCTQLYNLWLNRHVIYRMEELNKTLIYRQKLYPGYDSFPVFYVSGNVALEIAEIFQNYQNLSTEQVFLILDLYLRCAIKNYFPETSILKDLSDYLLQEWDMDQLNQECCSDQRFFNIINVIGGDLKYSDFYRYSIPQLVARYNSKYTALDFSDYFEPKELEIVNNEDIPFQQFLEYCRSGLYTIYSIPGVNSLT